MPQSVTLSATSKTVHFGFFDAGLAPVLRVQSGDMVTIEAISGETAHLPPGDAFTVLHDHQAVLDDMPPGPGPHFMTGPIHVEGAQPGDWLKVEILDVSLRQDWGWNAIGPLFGTLQDDFQELILFHAGIDIEAGTVTLPWGRTLKAAPFFGVMGNAPPPNWGRVSSIQPRNFGGNLDNKDLVAGTVLWLPVFNEGALFSVGDGHALQGHGEVSGTPVETGLSGTFRLTVEKAASRPKGAGLAMPHAETPAHYITMAFDEDLDNAARTALRAMISFITGRTDLTAAQAYALCSITADLVVTQTVDVNKGIHMLLPKTAID